MKFKAKRYKIVIKCDLDGNEIEKYNSISEASRKNNISITSISSCCHGKQKKAGDYIWKFEK